VAKAAKKAGIKTTILGAQSRYDLTVLKRLAKFINNGNFDIVHTHGARANLFVSMIKKQIKAKWIITVHSDPLKDFEGRGMIGNIFTKLNIMALKKADGIFAITQNFSDLLVEKVGIPKTKICVIYNGIFFHDNKELPKKYAHPYFNIINVGRRKKLRDKICF
jgi:glycosyltransferase involved in cell wall biosynthesis